MGKFDNIIIVSDIDGTFLGKEGRLVQRNLDAVEYFKQNGGSFTVATGREEFLIYPAIPNIPDIVNIPIIACNGSYIYDLKADSFVYEEYLHDESAYKILMEAKKRFTDVGIRISAEGRVMVEFDFPQIKNVFAQFENRYVVCPFEKVKRGNWHKIVFEGEPDRISRIREYLDAADKEHFEYMLAWEKVLEIQPKKGTKGAMLGRLKQIIGKENAKLFAVGDYENDEIMLRSADFAVVPSNGLQILRDIKGSINVGHHDLGAIADLIELIEAKYI